MKFVMSFSCGKDSMFAMNQMIEDGHQLIALIVACSKQTERSLFHGADEKLLDQYSEIFQVPVIRTFTDGEDYTERFVEGLRQAKALGAEAACFGDLALPDSKDWNESCALSAGLQPVMPLWQRDREEYVNELIDKGFKCLIKVVDTNILPESLLGQFLDNNTAALIRSCGADVCGENGEYHTLIVDGPQFSRPLTYSVGEIGQSGHCSYLIIE